MKKYLILFFILTLFLAGLLYLDKASFRPLTSEEKEKALTKILGRAPKTDEVEKVGYQVYKGKYFSLQYPGSATLYSRKNKNIDDNASILDHFRFNQTSPRITFVAQVRQYSGESINDDPGVITRRLSGSYKETEIKIGEYYGASFIKGERQVEKSAFFLKDNLLYTFVATGSDLEEIETVFSTIMASVVFESFAKDKQQ